MEEDRSSIMVWPVDTCWPIRSLFGERVHPITRVRSFHSGVDIACPEGTPVFAPFPGRSKAIWTDEKNGGGLSLRWEGILTDANGTDHQVVAGFAHLLKVDDDVVAFPGRYRKSGTVIAYTGGVPGHPGAGKSTGAHLHLTIRVDGRLVNPCDCPQWNAKVKA